MPSMTMSVTGVREFARAHEAHETRAAPAPGEIGREIVDAATSRPIEGA
jgi:hypothetical protein